MYGWSSKITIAEVELLPAGSLDPNEIHIPGILVNNFSRREIRETN
jgi:3-oxoacid CoA-transferase subunit A